MTDEEIIPHPDIEKALNDLESRVAAVQERIEHLTFDFTSLKGDFITLNHQFRRGSSRPPD
jgi:hypothetical protein